MTPEQFFVLQQYLLSIYWPFIRIWIVAFLAAAVLCAVAIVFLGVSRELLTRAV